MPTDIDGIPLHPLVVHAVVVLLPLAALGVLVLAVVPRWRKDFAGLLLVVTAVGTALVPVATNSGQALEEALGAEELVERHSELGGRVIWFALALLAAAVGLWWLGRRQRAGRAVGTGLSVAIPVVSVVVALGVMGLVTLTGHSGAKAVWEGTPIGEEAER